MFVLCCIYRYYILYVWMCMHIYVDVHICTCMRILYFHLIKSLTIFFYCIQYLVWDKIKI